MSGVTSFSPLLFTPILPQSNPRLKPTAVAIPQNRRRLSCSTASAARSIAQLSQSFRGSSLVCSSSSPNSTDSTSGENESKSVLDAFFLGKALAEVLNERIESAVGEVLSSIGKIQSEQQKQIQSFQEDVVERAKRAKQGAAAQTTSVVETSSTADDPKTYASSTATDDAEETAATNPVV
ncbi:Uncharacterized protein At4g13200, chloroplastic [Linum perenne]